MAVKMSQRSVNFLRYVSPSGVITVSFGCCVIGAKVPSKSRRIASFRGSSFRMLEERILSFVFRFAIEEREYLPFEVRRKVVGSMELRFGMRGRHVCFLDFC